MKSTPDAKPWPGCNAGIPIFCFLSYLIVSKRYSDKK